MSDLISRQDAIDAINEYGSVWMEYTDTMSIDEIAERALKASKQSMVKILHDLPSAQTDDFIEFLWNIINPNEMQKYLEMYWSGEKKTNG